jgi:hypothetical protein
MSANIRISLFFVIVRTVFFKINLRNIRSIEIHRTKYCDRI